MEHWERLEQGLSEAELTSRPEQKVKTDNVKNTRTTSSKKEPAKEQALRHWDIEIKNLSFAYPQKELLLDNINLRIREGEKVGLVAASGMGKSTLFKLIRGVLHPTSGEIFIGNRSLRTIESSHRNANIMQVSHDSGLFNLSLYENIIYGKAGFEESKEKFPAGTHSSALDKVIKEAQPEELVQRLPNGLDTIIGTKGASLSADERARVALARIFLHDPRIILLDEIFAAIDSDNERSLTKTLEELSQGKTVFLIAHRLFSLHLMDRILVLDDTHIVADGSHEKLIQSSALYASFYEKQKLK